MINLFLKQQKYWLELIEKAINDINKELEMGGYEELAISPATLKKVGIPYDSKRLYYALDDIKNEFKLDVKYAENGEELPSAEYILGWYISTLTEINDVLDIESVSNIISALKNQCVNSNIESIPDYMAYAAYVCLACGYQPTFISREECPSPRHRLYVPENTDLSTHYESIEIGKIVLSIINDLADGKQINISARADIRNNITKMFYDRLKSSNLYSNNVSLNKWINKDTLKEPECFGINLILHYANEYNKSISYAVKPKYIDTVTVEKLFGYYSYTLKFNKLYSVVIGPNGIGKTTIFRMLKYTLIEDKDFRTCCDNIDYLFDIPYEKFEIKFIDNTRIILKNDQKENILHIDYQSERTGGFDDVFAGTCIDRNIGEPHIFPEAVKQHYAKIHALLPYVGLKNRFCFVETNRGNDIQRIANEVGRRYRAACNMNRFKAEEYLKKHLSLNALDEPEFYRDFNDQISILWGSITVNYAKSSGLPLPEEIANIISNAKKRGFYCKNLSLDSELIDSMIGNYDASIRPEDCQDDSRRRICESVNVLNEFMNNFKSFKEYFERMYYSKNPSRKSLDVKNGHIIVKNSMKKIIQINELSTGERNLLSILYYIIFNTTNDAIVFVDEPEISLHIMWQNQLAESINEIIDKKSDMQVILFSHSTHMSLGNADNLVGVKLYGH